MSSFLSILQTLSKHEVNYLVVGGFAAVALGAPIMLGAIGKGHTYEELLPRSEPVQLSSEFTVRVLSLEAQIEIKEEIKGEKDVAVLPVLRRTLEEKRRLK